MSIPTSDYSNSTPMDLFSLSLKKLYDRCEMLYARVEQSAKEALKIKNTHTSHADLELKWNKRLESLKDFENQIFKNLNNAAGVKELEKDVEMFTQALQEAVDDLPGSLKPQLSTTNNRSIQTLAREAFQFGKDLREEELKIVFLNTMPDTGLNPFDLLQPEAKESLALELSHKDLGQLASTTRSNRLLAEYLATQKINQILYSDHSPPIEQATGSTKLEDIQEFIVTLNPAAQAKIKHLNLSNATIAEGSSPNELLTEIIRCCPNAIEVELGEDFPLDDETLRLLLENEKITKLNLSCYPVKKIPEEYLYKIVGIRLKPQNNDDLGSQIHNLQSHGAHLSYLKIDSSEITFIANLPDSLQSLNVSFCSRLEEIHALPPKLKSFNYRSCPNLTPPTLPESLKRIVCGGNRAETDLSTLPEFLEDLILSSDRLQEVTYLPPHLKSLSIGLCNSLNKIRALPESLKQLTIYDCKALRSLPQLHEGLTDVTFSSLKAFQEFPMLPSTLQRFEYSKIEGLETIPRLPASLKTLILSENEKLKSIQELPPTVKHFDCSHCWKLKTLPAIPKTLRFFNMRRAGLYNDPQTPPGCKVIKG